MKKLIIAILIIAAVFGMTTVSAGLPETLEDYTYVVNDGKAEIISANKNLSGTVVIPSAYGVYPVTGIGSLAFENNNSITKVIIPDTIETIGDAAFSGCVNLKSVVVAEGVKTVGAAAFRSCSSLKTVTLPEGVETIGDSAFVCCSDLMLVTLPESVKTMGDGVFKECDNLNYIYYNGSAAQWENILIGENSNEIFQRAYVHHFKA